MSNTAYQRANSSILTSRPVEGFKTVRTTNSGTVGPSGQGTQCDFSTNITPSLNPIVSAQELQYLMDALYVGDWQAKKIIDLPVDDMLREPFSFEGLDDKQADDFTLYLDSLNFYETLSQALRMERLYGGAVIFLGIKDEVDDVSQPINYSQVGLGDLLYLNAVPRTRIHKGSMQLDPLLPDYGKPITYMLNSKEVHKDRLLIFDGSPIGFTYGSNYTYRHTDGIVNIFQLRDGFGLPVLLPIYNDLMWSTGTRQAAYHLLNKASVTIYKGDIQSANAMKDTHDNITSLQNIINCTSVYRAALINSVPGQEAGVENIDANFGAIPELINIYSKQLAAASNIPVTVFLGESPKGMNATGESDSENHYTRIASEQQNKITPVLKNKFLKLALPSAGIGVNIKNVQIIYKPLWDLDEEAKARVRQLDTQTYSQLRDIGLVSDEQAREELKQREVFLTDFEEFPEPELPDDDEDEITDATEQGVKDKIAKIGEDG